MTADERVAAAFIGKHPEEAARVLDRAPPVDAAAFLAGVPADTAAAVFRALGPAPAAACADALTDESLAGIVDALPLDAAGATMRGIERSRHDDILSRVGEERRDQLRATLTYPDNTAGALADPLVLSISDDLDAGDAQKQLRGPRQHLLPYLYVVTRERRLVGVLALGELVAARPRARVAAVMRQPVVRLDAYAELATIAVHPAWHDYDALPVVDSADRLVGAIRHKTVRRLSRATGQQMLATLVGLSELYWAGLAGMLSTITLPRAAEPASSAPDGEVDHVA
ncbi:MAG TPA: hypothetical protein VLE53_10230 [Gemmatimonadaceae bacterium]|nr:hypothetical protein [Gemmatimonadaceae bacterium]